MRRGTAIVIAGALAASPRTGQANWRDGCPPPDPPAAGRARRTFAKDWGVAADLDSAFNADRAGVALRGAYFTSQPGFPRTQIFAVFAHGTVGADVGGKHRLGLSLMAGRAHRNSEPTVGTIDPADTEVDRLSNLVIDLWWRHDRINGDWRSGWAAHVIVGAPIGLLWNGDDADELAHQLQELATSSPLEPQLFAPGAVGAAGERRSEMRGCYGVFVHLRLGALYNPGHAATVDHVSLIPSAAVGLHVSDEVSVYAQAGLQADIPKNSLGTRTLQRYRIGFEWTHPRWAFGSHLDLMAGAFDGTFWGVSVRRVFGRKDRR